MELTKLEYCNYIISMAQLILVQVGITKFEILLLFLITIYYFVTKLVLREKVALLAPSLISMRKL